MIAISFVIAGDKNVPLKYSKDRSVVMTVAATGILGKGGGLLERANKAALTLFNF